MTCLICGSMAYDNLMSFPGVFSDSILPDQLHNLNVGFLVPNMRREFGGTAGNIAYNMKLLGDSPFIMATMGKDGNIYLDRLKQLGLSCRYIKTINSVFCAQAFVTTDSQSNQITAFHPGAMNNAHENKVSDAIQKDSIKLVIVSPDGKTGMIEHANECAQANVPFIFDPGQGLPMFDKDELRHFIDIATYITVNEYESEMLSKVSGYSHNEIASHVKAYIVTRSEHGVQLYTPEGSAPIQGVKASTVADPTGCGDAFRGGLMYALTHNMGIEDACKLGNVMGSIKIEVPGPQSHAPSKKEIADRFENTYGARPF